MIPERYMVTAVTVDGGERVTGYLIPIVGGKWVIAASDGVVPYGCEYAYGVDDFIEIDPTTIQPVKVKPSHETYLCPNCDSLLDPSRYWLHHYCPSCGMALDWQD